MVGYAAIHSNDQANPLGAHSFDSRQVKPVTFSNTVRNIISDVLIALSEESEKNDDRGYAVSVIIAINDHLLLPMNSKDETLDSFIHVLHQKGIVKIAE